MGNYPFYTSYFVEGRVAGLSCRPFTQVVGQLSSDKTKILGLAETNNRGATPIGNPISLQAHIVPARNGTSNLQQFLDTVTPETLAVQQNEMELLRVQTCTSFIISQTTSWDLGPLVFYCRPSPPRELPRLSLNGFAGGSQAKATWEVQLHFSHNLPPLIYSYQILLSLAIDGANP